MKDRYEQVPEKFEVETNSSDEFGLKPVDLDEVDLDALSDSDLDGLLDGASEDEAEPETAVSAS